MRKKSKELILDIPVGTILHEYPELPIPEGYVLCDGKKIKDKDSPLYGRKAYNFPGFILKVSKKKKGKKK